MQDDEKSAKPSRAKIFHNEDVMHAMSGALLDESSCRKLILQMLWPDGAICPNCGTALTARSEQKFWTGERFRCQSCGTFSTALSGTFLSGSQFSFAEIVILAYSLSLTSWDRPIAEVLAVHPQTIKLWRLKFGFIEKLREMALFPGR